MYLTRLRVKNFKSIRDAEIYFPPLTLVVGANAAGKSNLVSVFKFLSDLLSRGLESAIALRGGIEWLVNANLPKGTPVEIAFTLDLSDDKFYYRFNTQLACSYYNFNYHIQIFPHKRGNGYKISHDELTVFSDWVFFEGRPSVNIDFPLKIGCASENIARKKSGGFAYQYEYQITDSEIFNKLDESARKIIKNKPFEYYISLLNKPENQKEAILHSVPLMFPSIDKNKFIRAFDFDPRALKRPSPVESVPELVEDGANLANVLRNILRNKQKRGELTALLNDFLPFAEKIDVDSNADKSFSYKIRENYYHKAFHESFLSDGTVSILAILTALYFQEKANIVILEEPERNLHPRLLSKLLAAAEDVSSKKQIILTTHNPEFLKHAKIEYVLLISRDSDGFTVFQSPKDSAAVRAFMENDLGMDDLFLRDMLGA